MIHKFILYFFLIELSLSCADHAKSRFLGKVQVPDCNVTFKIYQDDKFDDVVGIYYEILDQQQQIMQAKTLLVGTSDFDRNNTKDFFTGNHDSIIYLSFLNKNTVYAIYNLRENKNCNDIPCELKHVDSFEINILKKADPNLKFEVSIR